MNWKNLITRSLTGIVFLAVMIGGTLWNVCSYATLYSIIVILTIAEFERLVSHYCQSPSTQSEDSNIHKQHSIAMPLIAALAFILSVLVSGGWIEMRWLMIIPLCLLILACTTLFKNRRLTSYPLFRLSFSFWGSIYIVLPFAITAPLVLQKDGTFSPLLLLSIFVFIWISDSAAYFFGSLLGKHRLFERVSPKKSWEGSIGGIIFALLAGYVFSLFFTQLTCSQWLTAAVISVTAGTLGDLFESMLKRTLNIKDSGTILPGHGGMLDRFDAALFALPATISYLLLIL